MYNSYDIRQLFVKLLIYQGVILITFLFTYFFFCIFFFKNPQLLTKDKSFCVLHNEILVFTYLVFYIVYKYKNWARIVRIQYFTNTQKVYNRHGISLRCLLPTCSWPIRREVDDTWPNLFPPYFWLTCHFFSTGIHVRSQTRAFFHTRIFLLFESTMCIKLHG